ncbi:T9SS type A sorting domain-containing protein [Paraflavisolibacter sp. H34]|uniref:T9SS type A sorting domain-containing protein n=1 Tax=Huijunlia imazamoxiresistens TaxID=3127457 RepID=UPI0030164A8A
MKKFTLSLWCAFVLTLPLFSQEPAPPGTTPSTDQKDFTTVTRLEPLTISSHTADKPQGKVWTHAGKWWTVLSTSSGTKMFRLDGTAWTEVLTLINNPNSKADCQVAGDLVHIVLFRGGNNSYLVSAEYDAATGTYKLWSQRPDPVNLGLDSTAETATLALDGSGRMWVAADAKREVHVRWSDAPYTTWSAPLSIAPRTDDDDICAVAALPGKIGVFWSNMKDKRFGFKTHTDGADPSQWSEDEVPAGASALNVGKGMVDDHLNLMVAGNGTLYCAVKTSYDTPGYPNIALLVRRPSGNWDSLYTVTTGSDGTRPVVLLNERLNRLKVLYTSSSSGGDILYRESPANLISFGSPKTLFTGSGVLNYATSTHQTYSSEVVVLATGINANPMQAVGVILADHGIAVQGEQPLQFVTYPNPSPGANITVAFSLAADDKYTLTLYDMNGRKLSVLGQGAVLAGQLNTLPLEAARLQNGMYLIELRTSKLRYTYKVIIRR